MTVKFKILALPYPDKTYLPLKGELVRDVNGDIILCQHDATVYTQLGDTPLHLYILSDESPKENDWGISWGVDNYTAAFQFTKEFRQSLSSNMGFDFKKVLASTDPTLGLPSISYGWISNIYVHLSAGIYEVLLQCDDEQEGASIKLKINELNEVIISGISKMHDDKETPLHKSKRTLMPDVFQAHPSTQSASLFIPIHLAKLLKDKGFTEKCLAYYDARNLLSTIRNVFEPADYNSINDVNTTSAPLYSQVERWLIKEHQILFGVDHDDSRFFYFINVINKDKIISFDFGKYDDYEECYLAGLEKSLSLI